MGMSAAGAGGSGGGGDGALAEAKEGAAETGSLPRDVEAEEIEEVEADGSVGIAKAAADTKGVAMTTEETDNLTVVVGVGVTAAEDEAEAAVTWSFFARIRAERSARRFTTSAD